MREHLKKIHLDIDCSNLQQDEDQLNSKIQSSSQSGDSVTRDPSENQSQGMYSDKAEFISSYCQSRRVLVTKLNVMIKLCQIVKKTNHKEF